MRHESGRIIAALLPSISSLFRPSTQRTVDKALAFKDTRCLPISMGKNAVGIAFHPAAFRITTI